MNSTLRNFTFEDVRNKGAKGCGYTADVEVPIRKSGLLRNGKPFLSKSTLQPSVTATQKTADVPGKKIKYSFDKIVEVLFKKTNKKLRKLVLKDRDLELNDATGTVKSVREWSLAVFSKDARQRRAFEAITAAFLLTFFDLPEDSENDDPKSGNQTKYCAAE